MHVHDVITSLLNRHVLIGDSQLLLDRSNGEIGTAYLCRNEHHYLVVTGHRGQKSRVGGLDATLEFAPEINLPGSAHSKVVLHELEIAGRRIRRILTRPQRRRIAGDNLGLRVAVASGDTELCP